MARPWIILAHLLVVLLPGCPDSHGTTGDAGRDAPATDSPFVYLDSAAIDASTPLDAPLPAECGAAEVTVNPCPMFLCDALPLWYWDGEQCFDVDCGACEGPHCGTAGFGSREECVAAHASCVPQLCRDTGGTWMFWAEECGHRICGNPGLAICESGEPVCDCGPYRVFDFERGCVEPDPHCGVLPTRSREELCRATGGSWDAICCDSRCGELCPLACAGPACRCGPTQIFDEERGCIEATECFERETGETCDLPHQRCADRSNLCVPPCDGPGCRATCEPLFCAF
jgi:hypothetical protein